MKRANRLMLMIGVALAALSFVAVLAFGGFGAQNGAGKAPPQMFPSSSPPPICPLGAAGHGRAAVTTTTGCRQRRLDTYQHPQEVVGKVVRRAVPAGHGPDHG